MSHFLNVIQDAFYQKASYFLPFFMAKMSSLELSKDIL